MSYKMVSTKTEGERYVRERAASIGSSVVLFLRRWQFNENLNLKEGEKDDLDRLWEHVEKIAQFQPLSFRRIMDRIPFMVALGFDNVVFDWCPCVAKNQFVTKSQKDDPESIQSDVEFEISRVVSRHDGSITSADGQNRLPPHPILKEYGVTLGAVYLQPTSKCRERANPDFRRNLKGLRGSQRDSPAKIAKDVDRMLAQADIGHRPDPPEIEPPANPPVLPGAKDSVCVRESRSSYVMFAPSSKVPRQYPDLCGVQSSMETLYYFPDAEGQVFMERALASRIAKLMEYERAKTGSMEIFNQGMLTSRRTLRTDVRIGVRD